MHFVTGNNMNTLIEAITVSWNNLYQLNSNIIYFQVTRELYGQSFGKPGLTFLVLLSRSKSKGTLRLKSANPFDHPLIDPNYLSERDDVEVLKEGMMIL